ncbi:MAG: oxidoreductase [Alphaproteobacteria bacterium]|nr:MAG: oxidoreductase [Alphaproteobacteria bacterium]
MTNKLTFAAIGLDHRHIYTQAQNMMDVGGVFKGWWTEGEPQPLAGFKKRFPDVPRFEDRRALLEDPEIDLIIIAGIPNERAAFAIEAMKHGKDVMTDKPGCTTLEQLAEIKKTVNKTNRIWSINFSERFEVPSVTKVTELLAEGAIGQVVQTIGMGPHRLNKATRPDWFFEHEKYGGIICDIASHQIDQFLAFTGSDNATINFARVGNFTNPETPELEDFGEVSLSSELASGYARVDWYTPDGLPTWGDGRIFILGTEGTIEMRKYCDVGRNAQLDNIILTNGSRCEYIDGRDAGLPYFKNFADDILNRTETAMRQSHAFKVTELTLMAQKIANRGKVD